MSIKDKDNGAQELLKRMKMKLDIRVGILGDEASAQHADSDETNVAIGTKHEFGIDVPQRSFIRETVDLNTNEIKKVQRLAAKKIIQGKSSNIKRFGDLVGLSVVAMIQERISDGIPPPNSPITIEKKGSSKPLIDTGQLRSSITYDVKVSSRG